MIDANPLDLPTSERERLYGLDALRAIAVTLTFVMHFAWLYGNTFLKADLEFLSLKTAAGAEQTWLQLSYYSLYGVYFFFMISGLLIGRQWIGSSERTLFGFLVARVWRIFPALWAALAGFYLVTTILGSPPSSHWGDVAANALLINWFAPQWSTPWLIVSWSLQVEWIFYLAMPAVAMLIRSITPPRQIPALMAVAILLALSLKALGGRHFAYPLFFAVGIAVALRPAQARRIGEKLPLTALLTGLVALQALYAWTEPIGANKPAWTVSAFDGFAVLFAVLGGATFARVAFAPPRWMLNRFVLLLGRVSYSFYLWHLTVLILVFHLIHKTSVFVLLEEMHWVLRWVLLAGITGLLSICTAIVSYRLFEATYFSARKIQPPT